MDKYELKRFTTSDGMGLLIIGILALLRGLSYAPWIIPAEARGSHVAETWLPMDAWSVLWTALGLLCVAASMFWASRAAAVAVGLSVALHSLFGFSFLWGTIHHDMDRGWVSALSYFAIALLTLWAMGRGRREDSEVTFGDNPN